MRACEWKALNTELKLNFIEMKRKRKERNQKNEWRKKEPAKKSNLGGQKRRRNLSVNGSITVIDEALLNDRLLITLY